MSESLLSITALAKVNNHNVKDLFALFSDMELITRKDGKWELTDKGRSHGGETKTSPKYGCYPVFPLSIIAVAQPESILEDTTEEAEPAAKPKSRSEISFRQKFPAKHRANDGHFVRSKSELLIDNWLFAAEIAHAYEKKLPIQEELYCDFYIPSGKVFIEFWGLESDAKYASRQQTKIDLYQKYKYNLIELKDDDVNNIDDCLPALLLKAGVKSFNY